MTTKLSIPDTVHDMDISHLPFFLALAKYEKVEIEDMKPTEVSDLNSLFFSKDSGAYDIYDSASNKLILSEIAQSCGKYEAESIQPEFTINDVTYVWQTDYSKQPVSFHRDITNADFKEHPLDLMAFCYIEKGMMYNELDKAHNIINERRARGEAFRDHVTLAQYLDLQAFFLESYSVFLPYLKIMEAKRKPKLGTGKKA